MSPARSQLSITSANWASASSSWPAETRVTPSSIVAMAQVS
jgi:hypothetical protein